MVVDDPFEAARLVAAGHDVILVVPAGAGGGPDPTTVGAGAGGGPDPAIASSGPGRLALYVTTGHPADAERAAAMDAELFGPRPSPS